MIWSSKANGKLVGGVKKGLGSQENESIALWNGDRIVYQNRLRMPKGTLWLGSQVGPDASYAVDWGGSLSRLSAVVRTEEDWRLDWGRLPSETSGGLARSNILGGLKLDQECLGSTPGTNTEGGRPGV